MGKRCQTCNKIKNDGRRFCSQKCKQAAGLGVCKACGKPCDRYYCSQECCRTSEYRRRKIARLRDSRKPIEVVNQYLCKSCGNFVIYEPCRICLAKEARNAAKEISRNKGSESVVN